jgi:hypothetical protein
MTVIAVTLADPTPPVIEVVKFSTLQVIEVTLSGTQEVVDGHAD